MRNKDLIEYLIHHRISCTKSNLTVLAELEAKFGYIGTRNLIMCALEAGYAVTPRRESMLLYFERVI